MAEKLIFKRRVFVELTEYAGVRDGVVLRKLKMEVVEHDAEAKVQKISFGTLDNNRETKVILLVGQTGTGKSTLINAMTNYIFCTDFEDDYRLILVDEHMNMKTQAESQTDMITAYQFSYVEGMPFEYNYIVIDTPGFGDTKGFQEDDKLMKQLEMFFHKNYGFDHINGIGFVIQSSAVRLTPGQKYIFEGLLTMFGKNIEDYIFIMATWAGVDVSNILDCIKEAGIKYKHFYKFDNCALYVDKTPKVSLSCIEEAEYEAEANEEYKNCYKKGQKNLGRFFTKLSTVSSSSLDQTKSVLGCRNKLKMVVEELRLKMYEGLKTLSTLQDQRKSMKQIQANLHSYKDYEFEVIVDKLVTNKKSYLDVLNNIFITDNADESACRIAAAVINPFFGLTTLIAAAFKTETTYEIKKNKEKRTNKVIYEKFNETNDEKISKESEIEKIEIEIHLLGVDILNSIGEAHACALKLEREALKPTQTSIMEYIDALIASEKNQMQMGYNERVENLEKIKNIYYLYLKITEDLTNLGKVGEDVIIAAHKWMKNE